MTATQHDLTLVRLTPTQVAEAVMLRNACAEDLTAHHGAGPWSSRGLPAAMRHQAREKHVLVARADGRAIATMTLSTQRPQIHRREWFADPLAIACYLTGLYVLPSVQGQGVGTWMMQQAERIARHWGCAALRFDAYVGPAGAVPFYHRLGYEARSRQNIGGVWLQIFERRLDPAPG